MGTERAARGWRRGSAVVVALLAAVPLGAAAAGLEVEVTGVDGGAGRVRVAVCTEPTFLTHDCPYHGSAPAASGAVLVRVPDLPPGAYAVQAFHDENGNADVDRNFLGLPLEGVGFSNDAPIRLGPPRWEDARFDLAGGAPARITLTLRYVLR